MPYKTDYLSDKRLVVQECWGAIDLNEAKEVVTKTVEYLQKYNVRHLLLDDTRLKSPYNFMEAYDFGAALLEKAGDTNPRNIAVVHPQADFGKMDYVVSEPIYRNKGWNYRVFADRKAALEWLRTQ